MAGPVVPGGRPRRARPHSRGRRPPNGSVPGQDADLPSQGRGTARGERLKVLIGPSSSRRRADPRDARGTAGLRREPGVRQVISPPRVREPRRSLAAVLSRRPISGRAPVCSALPPPSLGVVAPRPVGAGASTTGDRRGVGDRRRPEAAHACRTHRCTEGPARGPVGPRSGGDRRAVRVGPAPNGAWLRRPGAPRTIRRATPPEPSARSSRSWWERRGEGERGRASPPRPSTHPLLVERSIGTAEESAGRAAPDSWRAGPTGSDLDRNPHPSVSRGTPLVRASRTARLVHRGPQMVTARERRHKQHDARSRAPFTPACCPCPPDAGRHPAGRAEGTAAPQATGR